MARVQRTAVNLAAAGYPTLPLTALIADIAMTAADAANKEMVTHTDQVAIFYRNSGAVPRTVTITGVSLLGRTQDIGPYTVGVGLFGILGPFPANAVRQTNGQMYFEASHADVLFACVVMP